MAHLTVEGTLLTVRDDVKTDPYVYALGKHMGDTYGDGPYIHHVEAVFGLVYEHLTALLGEDAFAHEEYHPVLIAALLHDVVEDCFEDRAVGMAEVTELFGDETAVLVDFLTDMPGETRAIRKHKFFARMSGIKFKTDKRFMAMVVKVCDRIANLSFSILDGDTRRVKMYLKEMPDFLYLMREIRGLKELAPLYDHLVELRDKAKEMVGEDL